MGVSDGGSRSEPVELGVDVVHAHPPFEPHQSGSMALDDTLDVGDDGSHPARLLGDGDLQRETPRRAAVGAGRAWQPAHGRRGTPPKVANGRT